jgi:soluble lytic murein transglycosylase-like protein
MTYVQIILQAAKAAKTSGLILLAICTHETRLRTVVVQNDGGTPSIGICQLKLDTAKMLGFTGTATDLLNPKTNAHFAALYLKYQYERYGNYCHAVSAFNAGRYNESKILPGFPRNLKYVNNVRNNVNKHFQNLISCDSIYKERSYGP